MLMPRVPSEAFVLWDEAARLAIVCMLCMKPPPVLLQDMKE